MHDIAGTLAVQFKIDEATVRGQLIERVTGLLNSVADEIERLDGRTNGKTRLTSMQTVDLARTSGNRVSCIAVGVQPQETNWDGNRMRRTMLASVGHRVEAIVEKFSNIQEDLEREQR